MPDDSSDDEEDSTALLSSTKQRLPEKEEHIGKVVCVENSETKKKASKENWFPALVVAPTAQDAVRIRVKDEYLVRSFKDGRYYTVPKKEASDFRRDRVSKQNSDAVFAALEYLNNDSLPTHWDREVLFALSNCSSESEGEEDDSDTSDDEPREEKDHFVAQLYKYMDDRGTPLNKGPSIVNKDVDLYRLFRAVQKLNGYNKVTGQSQWKQIATRLGYSPVTLSIQNLVKQAYKKFLLPFEEFDRKLGCTMVAHPRANRIKGRSLVRANSVASPKPDKDNRAGGGPCNPDESETTSESGPDNPKAKRKLSTSSGGGGGSGSREIAVGKVKAMVIKYEDKVKDEIPDDEVVLTKEIELPIRKMKETKEEKKDVKPIVKEVKMEKVCETPTTKFSPKAAKEDPQSSPNASTQPPNSGLGPSRKDKLAKRPPPPPPSTVNEERKMQIKKRRPEIDSEKVIVAVDKEKEKEKDLNDFPIEVGDKLKVYYHEQKVTYEAKVIEISMQQGTTHFLVHYTGWNTRYDEWVPKERIAENLTNNKTNKKAKTGGAPSISKDKFVQSGMGSSIASTSSAGASASSKSAFKRGRGSSRGDSQPPRSTTPSSVASNSSRTKSPATPAQRRTTRGQPSSIRRTSNNTDISSLQTDSETDSDEPVKKPTNRKIAINLRPATHQSTSTSGNSVGTKTNSNASSEEESPSSNNAKGRDFDLNQIRSELKGFKDFKSPTPEDDETTDTEEVKKFDFPSSASVTTSDSIASDLRKPIVSSDSESESDSFGDDDSQFSDKTTTLDNISEKLQEKFKAGKLQTDVFKKIPVDPVERATMVLKPSGIDKISKLSTDEVSIKLEKVSVPEKTPPKPAVMVAKDEIEAKPVALGRSPSKPKPSLNVVSEKVLFADRIKSASNAAGLEKKEPLALASRSIETIKTESTTSSTPIKSPIKTEIDIDSPKPECDIYEFKEPEPFEFEIAKKLSPETDKKSKKKPLLEAFIESKPAAVAAKKIKKSPIKEEKFKSSALQYLDEPMHSPPHIMSSTTPESIFDSLRKSPSFNLSLQSQNERDDGQGPSTSSMTESDGEQQKPTTNIMKPSFISSFIETSPAPPIITNVASPPLSMVVPLSLLMESPPKAKQPHSSNKQQIEDKLKIFVPGRRDSNDPDDVPVSLDTVKKIHFSEEMYVVPPQCEKRSSIADKVLKALNQQKTDAAAASKNAPSGESSSKVAVEKKTVVQTPKISPADPPKIELHALIKKESENSTNKPILSSPESSKIDILESIGSKNHDLSETIHKLESVIQQKVDIDDMSEDSDDSTDSEQRLIIQDEEDEVDDDPQPPTLVIEKEVMSIPGPSVVAQPTVIQSTLEENPNLVPSDKPSDAKKLSKPADVVKPTADIVKKPLETKEMKKIETKPQIPQFNKPIETVELKKVEPKKSPLPLCVQKPIVEPPIVEIKSVPVEAITHIPPITPPVIKSPPPAPIPHMFASVASTITIVPASVILPPPEPVTITMVAKPHQLNATRGDSPLATLLTSNDVLTEDDDDDDDEDEVSDLVIVTKEDDEDDDDEESNGEEELQGSVAELNIATSSAVDPDPISGESSSSHQQKESLALLLCEETIPGSPTPPSCSKDLLVDLAAPPSVVATQSSTLSSTNPNSKDFNMMFRCSTKPHPLEVDMKSVPMDLEPSNPTTEQFEPKQQAATPAACSTTASQLPTAIGPLQPHTVNMSPDRRDSISNDDSDDIRKPGELNIFAISDQIIYFFSFFLNICKGLYYV